MSGGVLYKVWKRPIIDGDLVEARMVFSYDGVTDVGIKRFSLEEVNSNMIPVSAAVKLMADHFSK